MRRCLHRGGCRGQDLPARVGMTLDPAVARSRAVRLEVVSLLRQTGTQPKLRGLPAPSSSAPQRAPRRKHAFHSTRALRSAPQPACHRRLPSKCVRTSACFRSFRPPQAQSQSMRVCYGHSNPGGTFQSEVDGRYQCGKGSQERFNPAATRRWPRRYTASESHCGSSPWHP